MRQVIPLERLQAVADLAPKPESKPDPKRSGNHGGTGPNHRLKVGEYLQSAGVEFRHETTKNGTDKYIIDPCPFNPDHTGKDAAVFRDADGKLTFYCFHDGCQGKRWADVKSVFGEPKPDHFDPPKPDHKARHREYQAGNQANEKPVEVHPVSITQLMKDHPELKPPVIHGLLRVGETMGIHAKSKVGKSWFAYMVALSVASGSYLFGRYRCEQGRVLIIDNELHPENLANRIPRVAKAMGIVGTDWESRLDILSLRGRLQNIFQLRSFFESLGKHQYNLFLLDALYRILPPGISENDNAAMAEVFNAIDQYTQMTGAAGSFVHHASKGDQSGKDVTDVGSGAGSIARAVDTHLVLRPHEERDCVVLEAALRSFAPIDPVVLRWKFPVWTPANELDPAALKGRKTAKDERQDKDDADGMESILNALKKHGPMSKSGVCGKASVGKYRGDRLLGKLEADGKIKSRPGTVYGNKCEIYELSEAGVVRNNGRPDDPTGRPPAGGGVVCP